MGFETGSLLLRLPGAGRRSGQPLVCAAMSLLAMLVSLHATGCDSSDVAVERGSDARTIAGRILALDGRPIARASVSAGRATTKSNRAGRFALVGSGEPQWITVRHPRFISRTRAAAPGSSLIVRLTPDDGKTVALHFGGDVMFGRRFYDPNEDGITSDGLLQPGSSASEHRALLRDVEPLLRDAHATVVTLEGPLMGEPRYDPRGPRPRRFHPTKPFVFASAPAAAEALRRAGVDAVNLGNNHMFDALEGGVTSSLKTLDETRLDHFGAGGSEEEAWRPAVLRVRGQSIAMIGCTTVTGEEHRSSYVAHGRSKGGAAACRANRIRKAVARARSRYGVVVAMIHGGYEYEYSPAPNVRRMSAVARAAGATLVINGHPHVIGGFDWHRRSLTAWSLGNLVFDQEVWPTFRSSLLTVHLRAGKIVRAYTEPLMIEGYRPKGVTGDLADLVARQAAGYEAGPFLIEDGAMEVDTRPGSHRRAVGVRIHGPAGVGQVFRLARGTWLGGFTGRGRLRLGRDLLWVGDFDGRVIGSRSSAGALWYLGGPQRVGGLFARSGRAGARLQRQAEDVSDAVLTPDHRILIKPGAELSVLGAVRRAKRARVRLQLSWYRDAKGPSETRTIVPLAGKPDRWRAFRLDARAPTLGLSLDPSTGLVDVESSGYRPKPAVGLYLRLTAPESGGTEADFDDLRVIEWAPPHTRPGPLYDHIRVAGAGKVIIRGSALPGAARFTTVPPPRAIHAVPVSEQSIAGGG